MTKFVPFALLATVATLAVIPTTVFAAEANQQVRAVADGTAATAAVVATAGKMLYGPDGRRLAAIYRATPNGDAQLIINSRLVTIPATGECRRAARKRRPFFVPMPGRSYPAFL
jgi:hypothetical protein